RERVPGIGGRVRYAGRRCPFWRRPGPGLCGAGAGHARRGAPGPGRGAGWPFPRIRGVAMSHSLTRHATADGPRWAVDGRYLPAGFSLAGWLALSADAATAALAAAATGEAADAPLLAPIEDHQEAWASGVTYLSSRMAREAESQSADVYQKVYGAQRPELFFKASGWRTSGHGQPIRFRADSHWNVPE